MNKKKLSVVMAGAMLATSVAPVLAADSVQKYEIGVDQLGVLRAGLNNFLETKKFVSTDKNNTLAGKSIYSISSSNTTAIASETKDVSSINLASLKAGDKIYILDDGHREVDGKFYSTSDGNVTTTGEVFDETKLKDTTTINKLESYTFVKDAAYDEDAKELVVTLKSADVNTGANIVLTYKVGDAVVDFDNVLTKDGVKYAASAVKASPSTNEVAISDVVSFAPKAGTVEAGQDIPNKKIAEIKIVANAENNLLVSDLYDGLMLTDKGQEILDALKEKSSAKSGIFAADGTTEITLAAANSVVKDPTTGITTFKINFNDSYGNKHEYTVRGTNEAQAKKLAGWLATQNPTVDVVAGDNRYETAVSISKKAFGKDFKLTGNANAKDVVIVNGTALVDGLAAAPYAKTLGNSTPILLSENDSLPKATKDYLKKLTEDLASSSMKNVTVHLVGGTSVLSKNVSDELKEMGFSVERVGGSNREETSMEVARKVNPNLTKAFVVGANGEADAMSIAGVASTTATKAPIIVAKAGGLSEDTIYDLKGAAITIIGGTNQITNEEFKALDEMNGNAIVERVSGKDRKATNAAIIKKYYGTTEMDTKAIIVAKDGIANKTQLVYALAASTIAGSQGSPIVLATDKLSNEQINEIELSTSSQATAIYQVGKGVERSVVEVLASKLGLK